ncbi:MULTISPECIES: amino acid adenylation domain-containing protein [unclassified Legionella]|uniref:amino acid adenylation domain-containing protein n=1 Tax=unclassified Legionella TaxID=2622702 RepID=UPI001E3EF4EA|nr:amino acid adenylation domain-containing protein [Legionella sp. 31fI33]MCC5015054.1 amino acid adenylation domain-containing protein [Legionella sp. 31fI33]
MEITTCLIGEDSLVIQCGDQLLSRNHRIHLVISPLHSVQEWAEEHGISWIASIDKLANIEPFQVDYLFSIVNSRILSKSIRNLARCYAINYHDSLLPKFAGLNSTSWALVHNEKEHGVTWHIMNDKIDEGEIVYQQSLPIHPNDTVLTLNLRCYENAISSFTQMIKLIEAGLLAPRKQVLDRRSYFAANHHLPCFGFIDWRLFSAKTIERITRALSIQKYSNHVGTLKLLADRDYAIVSQVELVSAPNTAENKLGTILAIEENGLVVSTVGQPIKFVELLSLAGEPISIKDWVNSHGLQVGQVLPYYRVKDIEAQRKYHSSALANERYWISKIKAISEHNTFNLQRLKQSMEFERLETSISLNDIFPSKQFDNKVELLLTAILIYLYRLNNQEQLSISIVQPEYNHLQEQFGPLFSGFLPLLFHKENDFSFQEALESVTKSLVELDKRSVFLSDIAARHPELKGSQMESGIVINLSGANKDYPCQTETVLYFNLDPDRGKIEILHRMELNRDDSLLKELMSHCTQHLVNILIQLINHPFVSARKFCFLTQAERYNLLQVWGKGKTRYLPEKSLVMLFETQVANNPDKVAIYFNHLSVTYLELNELAERVANRIRQRQLPPQHFIGLYLQRSIEMLAVILGILKANCAYVPLDTKYPLLKIEQIVEDANLSCLFIQQKSVEQFNDFFKQKEKKVELLTVEAILSTPQKACEQVPDGLTITNKIAYIMFTSGTTGRPKGVVVTHKNIINYCKWFTETTHFDEKCTIDFSSSIAFDLSVPCTLAPLLVGGAIAIATDAQKTNPQLYLTHLKKHLVTHAELTPGYLEMLLNYPQEVIDLVHLRYLLLGADVVLSTDVKRWLSLCPHHQVINEYGPTETTVSVTSYFVNKDELDNGTSVPIGQPAFNSTGYVLDQYKNLCPFGVKGELYIGGAQVTKGYLNRPDLTQEKFIHVDFTKPNEVLYRTGDMVCWLPGGSLQFFGRNDHQVKIQGYRIELPAIESILVKFPGIHQAVVVVMRGKSKEAYLRAYLVTDKKPKTSNELREYLADYLPGYMIPREFCVIKSIPLKENEKIDFTSLERQGFQLLRFNEQDTIDALTPHEKEIKGIWEQIFHRKVHSAQEDFFAMGGDSLTALQLISTLKTHYNLNLPLQLVFEYPTISSLATKIDEFLASKRSEKHFSIKANPLIKLATGKDEPPLFLVHPVGGSVFWYKQLASYLHGKYTVYGIQDPNLDGMLLRFNALEEMASFYLQEIKKVYSGDQYCLGGASFGATVAFEMAKQLVNEKKSIQFLGLFDGWAHYPHDLMQEDTSIFLSQTEDNQSTINNKTKESLYELEQYRKTLLLNYKLSSLKADVTLFKASELWPSFKLIDDFNNGWRPYVEGEIKQYAISGNHETMFFEPYVQRLVECLSMKI